MKLSQIIKTPAFALFGLSLLATFAQPAIAADEGALKAGQVLVTARQEAVPQKPADDGSSTQVIAVKVSVRKTTPGTAKLTVKTEFFGRDVDGGKRSPNANKSKDIELKATAFTEIAETSDPYVYTPAKKPKKGKPIPASGTRPLGWTVKVYQGSTLVAATASAPGFLTDGAKD